jgi:glycosyltransferase involved in cell wall biosynthesis
MRRGWPAPGAIHRLARILDVENADVIHTWMYHANLLGTAAARLTRRRPAVVWSLHAAELDFSVYRHLTQITTRLGAWLSTQPDVVLVNAEATRAFHERLGFHPRKWRLVHNGVDIHRFQRNGDARASVGAELGLAHDARLVGLFARWDPMKDHGTFLGAAGLVAESNRSAHFILAGEGIHDGNRELMRLVGQVPALRGRIHLLGLRHDMPRLNSALDIACVSSASGESFCLSAAEAMACEVPCVVTDLTFLPTLVGETGRVVPTRAPAAFASAIEDLLRGATEVLRAEGARARERIVDNFSLTAMVAEYRRIYREVVDARAGAAADPISIKEAVN